jgi:Zn finger protein HypA/HybF involved in hydrogenase expression
MPTFHDLKCQKCDADLMVENPGTLGPSGGAAEMHHCPKCRAKLPQLMSGAKVSLKENQ